MPKFHLVLIIHGHQPAGNFDFVFEQTYQRSYLPFLEVLKKHPKVRLGLHYTGPLIEWIDANHPEFLDSLREMIRRGQIELIGGGFYEPILISIPPEDQTEQLNLMRDYITKKFGVTPTGAWLAERVWEPQLPWVLASNHVSYTLVDDNHFLGAGFEPEQLFGDFVAEDRGSIVRLFPGLKALRYLLPFRPVEETISFLRDCAERHPGGMAAMGDDCEKFGAWPSTYDHCYRDGWLDSFFAALETAGDWLATTPPGEYIAQHEPLGRADLPTASYPEMMEWVLPTGARADFHAISHELASRPNAMRFLRGGQWRGFFSKYGESNLLHKKMLHVSEALRLLAPRRLAKRKQAKLARARRQLLRAQSNDGYWHGVFGGVYAPHLRTEMWRELVRAETLAAEITATSPQTLRAERLDFDADGREEVYVTSPRMAALLTPGDGGTMSALDFRPAGVTLINSMQRRVEAYHTRLREAAAPRSTGGVASIHDQMRVKEAGLENLLHYDRWPRNSFRMLMFGPEKTFENYQKLALDEHAGLAGGAYQIQKAKGGQVSLTCETPYDPDDTAGKTSGMLKCAKNFSFAHQDAGYRVDCAVALGSTGDTRRKVSVGIELVVNLLAPDAPDRYFDTLLGRQPLRWTAVVPAAGSPVPRVRLVDEWQNVAAVIEAPGALCLWVAPIDTVSESEEGFERVYQGSQILAVWPAEIAGNSPWSGEISLTISPAR